MKQHRNNFCSGGHCGEMLRYGPDSYALFDTKFDIAPGATTFTGEEIAEYAVAMQAGTTDPTSLFREPEHHASFSLAELRAIGDYAARGLFDNIPVGETVVAISAPYEDFAS